jgi:CubicO group peptidase (beta-lactamase class C family)
MALLAAWNTDLEERRRCCTARDSNLRRDVRWLVACLLALFVDLRQARADTPLELSEFARRWAEQSDFSGSFSMARGGQLLASIQRGRADAQGSPIGEQTAFWIGSVSKQFAAVATLLLAERGQVELAAPLARYLPELAGEALSRGGVRCSVEHVLSHGCGLPRELGFDPLYTARELTDPARARRLFDQVNRISLNFVPGTESLYSNVGYDLVGLLVQRVAGRSYEQVLRQEIWGPLGMSHTGIAPRAGLVLARGQFSVGFAWLDAANWLLLDPESPAEAGAAGNVYSTAADLQRFNHALHHGQLLTAASYQAMIQPRHGKYGLGLAISKKPFGEALNLVGSYTPHASSAMLIYVPGHDLELAAVANRVDAASGLTELADALIARATGAVTDTPGHPPSGLLLALSSAPLATLVLVAALVAARLWACFFRRQTFGRWQWCLNYHLAALALASFLFRWREYALDPALIAWGAAMLVGAGLARWWALPDWVKPSRKSAVYTELVSLGAVLVALVLYTPGRILWVFAGSCALEGLWLLASLAKRRRTTLLA